MARSAASGVLALFLGLMAATSAQARDFPTETIDGRTVAVVTVDGSTGPVKAVTFIDAGAGDEPACKPDSVISRG